MLCSEFEGHGKFRIKKWINNVENPIEEDMEPIKYLTKSVEERNSLFKILPQVIQSKKEEEKKKNQSLPTKVKIKEKEIEKTTPKERETQRAKSYTKKLESPIWRFINFFVNREFNNYILICDSEIELRILIR